MKFRVTMKTPDVLENAINDALQFDGPKVLASSIEGYHVIHDPCVLREKARKEILDLANKYFQYEEMLTVEFDTEKQTAIVLKKGN